MEHKVCGKYGFAEIKFVERRYIVRAKIRESEYYIESNDKEFAIHLFAKFAGKVGAVITPEIIKVEVTKNGKVVAHLGKWLRLDDGVDYALFMNTITPHGREEDVYLPASGVIRSFVIDLLK